jgi:dTDP-4-dehydrorhamnose 3,5-epimerase-like enzyme
LNLRCVFRVRQRYLNESFDRMPTHSIDDIQIFSITYQLAENGSLLAMERGNPIPFDIERVFVVQADAGAVRGEHAHKECAQFLICPNGSVEVFCDDGSRTATYTLDTQRSGLFLPPGIWASQLYQQTNSMVVVMCDRPYEEDDYIREYAKFKEYRKADT